MNGNTEGTDILIDGSEFFVFLFFFLLTSQTLLVITHYFQTSVI